MIHNPNRVKFIKEQYPEGTRIRLESMEGPYAPIPPGTNGTVNFVDDAGQIHMKWDNGRSLALIPGEDSFSKIPQQLQTLKLYMPLAVMQYERKEGGSLEEYPTELDQNTILSYQNQILAAILKERKPEEAERGLMKYYHEDNSVKQKVASLFFIVEQVGDRLMGVAECRIQGDLKGAEMEQLKDFIFGQVWDGFGEKLEQHPVKTEDGELYVCLGCSDKSWSIMTQDELEQGHQMGGMQLG